MSLRHAILGFLAVRPMSGYDLRKSMADTVGHFWPADQAQIYRTLTALLDDGLIAVETEPQEGRPDRHIHRILPRGEAELDDWLSAPLSPTPIREPFLMRLFLGGRLGPAPMWALLTARIAEADARIAALEAIQKAPRKAAKKGLEARLRLATVENGLAHARAERDWAHALREEIGGIHG